MKTPKISKSESRFLRQNAEKKLTDEDQSIDLPLSMEDTQRLLHELKVHELELEMQNEELTNSRDALEEIVHQYTELYEDAPVGYFSVLKDGFILKVNKFGAALLGMDRAKLINRYLGIMVTGDTRLTFMSFLQRIFETKSKESCEVKLLKKGEIEIDVRIEASIVRSGGEALLAIIDISESKRMEKILQEEERLTNSEMAFRLLFDNSPIPTFLAKFPSGIIAYANNSFFQELGKPSEQIIAKRDSDIGLYDPGEKESLKSILLKTGYADKVESAYHYPNEKEGTHLISMRLITFQNEQYCLATMQDITERKKSEDALKESEEKYRLLFEQLKDLNATKDKFFSIIAHDLKNPFNSILGFSDLLLSNFENYPLEDIKRFIGVIDTSAKKAYDLLENLLLWARAQTGKIEFHPEEIDLNAKVMESLNFMEPIAMKKSIKLIIDKHNDFIIYGDKNMIDTVLRNLLANAIKFSHPNGEVHVLLEDMDTAYCKITIKDHGLGIAKEDMDKLFRINSDIVRQGTSNEKGTGLGLVLCKEFVEKNQGKIWVESEKGKGSEFVFSLPKKTASMSGT